MAQWLSWLERRPVTAKVVGSSPIWVVIWGLSSAGRASALQAEGHRFEPYRPHFNAEKNSVKPWKFYGLAEAFLDSKDFLMPAVSFSCRQ